MDSPIHHHHKNNKPSSHARFAGRLPAGTQSPVTVSKQGVQHVRRLPSGEEQRILSVGLACSECFSGETLHRLLKPGLEYEIQVMEQLLHNQPAAPLSIHTSSGVPAALDGFLEALEPHLPWKNDAETLDWACSLQLEGASAVWAAIDLLLQVSMIETQGASSNRTKVAVGRTSYHGPPSTSFGAKEPIWRKTHQTTYPTPLAGEEIDDAAMIEEFQAFLDQEGDSIGVMLVEPQWGSSQAGLPWPKQLLQQYIAMAQARGIKVVCDEIMCGLGRHGHGSLFVSEAWELNPDAITFGKAIAGGVFPLSGAILKTGRDLLASEGKTVMQSHTYAGSSVRALMTATAVLQELPKWMPSVTKLGEEMKHIFRYINKRSEGMVHCSGQGLMWGGVFSRDGQCKDPAYRANLIKVFKKHCEEIGVVPYYVPVGGFICSPVMDVDVGTIYKIGEKLEEALLLTKEEVGWEGIESSSDTESLTASESSQSLDVDALVAKMDAAAGAAGVDDDATSKCSPHLHATRSCTSCTSFVCDAVRTRFLNV